jgi:hypothetical protein
MLKEYDLNFVKTLESALKDHLCLPVKEFALAVVFENGKKETYTSPSLPPYESRIFTERFHEHFRQNLRRAGTEGSYPTSR